MVRLSVATKERLGYDKRMLRITPRNKKNPSGQYQIRVLDNGDWRRFNTIRILSDFAAEGLNCRATRVWEVEDADENPSPPCVLKDSWGESHRTSETTVYEAVKKHLELNPSSKLLSYFLTPLMEHTIEEDVFDKDASMKTTLKKQLKHNPSFPQAQFQKDSSLAVPPTGGTPISPVVPGSKYPGYAPPSGAPYIPRKHTRIIFKEVGTRLIDLKCDQDALIAIGDAVKGEDDFCLAVWYDALPSFEHLPALSGLHSAGYMHCDVHDSNILLLNDNGEKRGLLIDLELTWTIKKGHQAADDVFTGKHCFIPSDIFRRYFTFGDRQVSLQYIPMHGKTPYTITRL